MIRKHSAVVASLELLQGEDIKDLDLPIQPAKVASQDCPDSSKDPASPALPGNTLSQDSDPRTLRDILMALTFPLVPTGNRKVSKLFHSIDWACSGRDAGRVVFFTAYKDRADVAEKLIHVLPTFIAWSENKPELKDKWFHPQLEDAEVDFTTDEDGNWTGDWTTEADKMNQRLIDEDMGVTIKFDNLDMLDNASRKIAFSEDLSVKFGVQGQASIADSTQQADSDAESLAAASSLASRGSGLNTQASTLLCPRGAEHRRHGR